MTSCDLGNLGPTEGQPVTYYWNPIYNFLGLLPWLLLVVGFALFRENRTGAALWILVPVLAGRLAWMAFAALAKIPSEPAVLLMTMVDSLLISLALIGLSAKRIGNRNRFITWLLSCLIFAVIFGATLVVLGLGSDALQAMIFQGIVLVILLLSLPIAAFLSRRNPRGVRFSLWTALWVWIFSVTVFCIVMLIQWSMSDFFNLFEMLLQVIVVASVFALILIVGLLSFEILWFKNAFWHKRFEALFGLKSQPVAEPAGLSELEPPPNE